MSYVEQPVGAGFSYSNDPHHYSTGDDRVASDAYEFIILHFSNDSPNDDQIPFMSHVNPMVGIICHNASLPL